MKSGTYIKLFMFVVIGLSLANVSLAHDDGVFWRPGDPIVPCAGTASSPDRFGRPPCDYCQILHLTRHLIDFVLIAAAPLLATLFFIVAGVYMMLGGSNPGMLSRGKSMFKSTFTGLLIVMLAWLLVNTIVQTIANPGDVGEGGEWWRFTCRDLSPGS